MGCPDPLAPCSPISWGLCSFSPPHATWPKGTRNTLGSSHRCHTEVSSGDLPSLFAGRRQFTDPPKGSRGRPASEVTVRVLLRPSCPQPAVPWWWGPPSPFRDKGRGPVGRGGSWRGLELEPVPPGHSASPSPVLWAKWLFPPRHDQGDLSGGSQLSLWTPKLDRQTTRREGQPWALGHPGVSGEGTPCLPGPGAVPIQAPGFSLPAGDGARQRCPLDFFLLPN